MLKNLDSRVEYVTILVQQPALLVSNQGVLENSTNFAVAFTVTNYLRCQNERKATKSGICKRFKKLAWRGTVMENIMNNWKLCKPADKP